MESDKEKDYSYLITGNTQIPSDYISHNKMNNAKS
jgi:hypothetical protein